MGGGVGQKQYWQQWLTPPTSSVAPTTAQPRSACHTTLPPAHLARCGRKWGHRCTQRCTRSARLCVGWGVGGREGSGWLQARQEGGLLTMGPAAARHITPHIAIKRPASQPQVHPPRQPAHLAGGCGGACRRTGCLQTAPPAPRRSPTPCPWAPVGCRSQGDGKMCKFRAAPRIFGTLAAPSKPTQQAGRKTLSVPRQTAATSSKYSSARPAAAAAAQPPAAPDRDTLPGASYVEVLELWLPQHTQLLRLEQLSPLCQHRQVGPDLGSRGRGEWGSSWDAGIRALAGAGLVRRWRRRGLPSTLQQGGAA